MGGFFGVVSQEDCIYDLYFGIDYHSHLGTSRGGIAVNQGNKINRIIHNIENTQFRSKFDGDLPKLHGTSGIASISDMEQQPLTIFSNLGYYAITTVGRINNIENLTRHIFETRDAHFVEMFNGEINQTELVAAIINSEKDFVSGINKVYELIDGSISILILTDNKIIAARDKHGRTPIFIGKKTNNVCATMESCALSNLGYTKYHELGSGEIVTFNHEELIVLQKPNNTKKICAFFWVYYGYPSSEYEGENVENVRYRCGQALVKNDNIKPDVVAGFPDSGTAHAIGYANEAKIPFTRPFVKYTPTWTRSFMPQNQELRNLVARMKIMPVKELIKNKKLLFCEDSIVRGTQIRETVDLLISDGADEVHVRSASPPIMYGCKYLNFSRSTSDMDLIARKEIFEIEGSVPKNLDEYLDNTSDKYKKMIEGIRKKLNLTSLSYQSLDDLLNAIGIDKNNICTYCWNGKS